MRARLVRIVDLYLRLQPLESKDVMLCRPSTAGANPGTVEDLEEVIANNCPVFYFHPAEK